MTEKYLQAKLRKRTCPVCLKIFYVRYGGHRHVLIRNLNVRKRNDYTCSKKCSNICNRVLQVYKNRRKKKWNLKQ